MQYGREATITTEPARPAGTKQQPTPKQSRQLADQRSAAVDNRAWHDRRATEARKRRKKAREEQRKVGLSGGRARAAAILDRLFGGTPVIEGAVQMVERDRSGRPVPVRNTAKDRSLAGKSRIRARRAARR